MLLQKSMVLLVNFKTLFDLKLSCSDWSNFFIVSFLTNSLILLIYKVFNWLKFCWKLNIYNRSIFWAENSEDVFNTKVSGNFSHNNGPVIKMLSFYIFLSFYFQKAIANPFFT